MNIRTWFAVSSIALVASPVWADVAPPETMLLRELAREPLRVIVVGGFLALAVASVGYVIMRRRRAARPRTPTS